MANVKLTWNDNSDNETGFKVYRRTGTFTATEFNADLSEASHRVDTSVNGGNGILGNDGQVQFVDEGVAANTYTYRVSAFNDAGETFCTNPDTVEVVVTA